MHWEAYAATDTGRRRPQNEDSHLLLTEAGIFAVADGMGGHAAGEVASAMAIAAVAAFASEATRPQQVSPAALMEMVTHANRTIHTRAAAEPEKAGMGTTLTVLSLAADAGEYLIAHVGDSRAYQFRRGRLWQITRDHTWVQLQVDAGFLSPAQARVHPRSNVITRSLGVEAEVEPDLEHGELQHGDLLMLCSDGLTGMLEDNEIAALMDTVPALPQLAGDLVAAANLRGGADNITVALIRVSA